MLSFDFEVQTNDEFGEPPEDGVYVYGLYLEGARWDRGNQYLTEMLPRVLYDEMPYVSSFTYDFITFLYVSQNRFGSVQ